MHPPAQGRELEVGGGGVAKGSSGISENKSIDFSDTEKLSLLGM